MNTQPTSSPTMTRTLGGNYYQPRQYEASVVESTPAGKSLPVVVVGAGPVGLATAIGIAQRGVHVTVVDSGTSASFGSRATCYSRHTMEIADRLGYGDALANRALAWEGGRSFYRDQEILHFKMPHSEHSFRPPMVNIGQCEYEDMQINVINKMKNIDILWGTTVTGIETDKDGVTLTVEAAQGERTLRADRVVASDGGRSKIRELMGLRLEGTAYEGQYVIADIHWKLPLPTERMVWFDPPSNPGSTVIMHRQPSDIWRIDYQLAPGEDIEAETTTKAITARITKHLAWLESNGTITAEPWTLEWHRFYKALALALPNFVAGHNRVVFAGDAAHLVPIFGVRGLNSGMEDADTLAWMLAAVANGDADESLLEAYSVERRDAWKQNISNASKSTLIMTPGSEGYRMTRDALLKVAAVMPEYGHLIDPRQSSATHAFRSPLSVPTGRPGLQVGGPLEDRRITLDGVETSLFKHRGQGFCVYGVGASSQKDVTSVQSRLAAALPHERITSMVLVEGADGGAIDAWQGVDGEVVIVRPDGIVLARGKSSELGHFDDLVKGKLASASEYTDPVTLSPEQVSREQVWLKLSEALDATDDKTALLSQLAFVLGVDAGPERFAQVLKALG